MIEAVFISDLHLHPQETDITQRFDRFLDWTLKNKVQNLYILGDFFHVWPGDDALDDWSKTIGKKLRQLTTHHIKIYYIHGNRDFLLGKQFATMANLEILSEPAIITFGQEKILLVHGDRYCTMDKGHVWLRRLTRNRAFPRIFQALPLWIRSKLVTAVRQRSQMNRSKPVEQLAIVPEVMLQHMQAQKCYTLIHGHIHKPGLTNHQYKEATYRQFVLSDWDDSPLLLCYDTDSFYFVPLGVSNG